MFAATCASCTAPLGVRIPTPSAASHCLRKLMPFLVSPDAGMVRKNSAAPRVLDVLTAPWFMPSLMLL